GSVAVWTKLKASGVTFHDSARLRTTTATGSGRQRRSEKASTASGTAKYRRRSTFSPSDDGIANAAVHAARYTTKSERRTPAPSTRQVNTTPRMQNVQAASSSCHEN